MSDENELDKIAKEIKMTATQTAPTSMSQAQNAALENALADLDELETITEAEELAPTDGEEIIEEQDASAALSDDDLDELELTVQKEEAKAEIYEAQEGAQIGATEDGSISSEGTVKRGGKAGAKRASTPRTARDLNAVDDAHFVLSGDVSAMSDEDKSSAKTGAIAAKPTQKKVAEKFENVFLSMQDGRAPSKYVLTAFGCLNANTTMSSADLIAAFKTSGVGDGTARSQSGQIMALFPVLGVAERDGKTLKLKDDSNIAEYLRKHLTA